MRNLILTLAFVGIVLLGNQTLSAHDAFKEPLEKRYNLKTVSCKTCHPDNKDRTIHNKFGMLFLEKFKGKDMSKKFAEAEAQGEEAKVAYEKIMAEEFTKALVEVEKTKLTIKELIEAGLLNGTRLDESKEKE